MIMPRNSAQTTGADQRSRYLAAALASLHDQSTSIRTPVALGADLLAEALLQSRYGPPADAAAPNVAIPVAANSIAANPNAADLSPGRVPTPGGAPAHPPQVAPVPQAAPFPSPSPGAPAPSAPAGTANAAPAPSPAAGAALAAAYAQGGPRQLQGTQIQAAQLQSGTGPQVVLAPSPELLGAARAAISRGADPAKVRARLAAHGYDPRMF